MRIWLLLVLAATASAQPRLTLQNSHTSESLRGASAVSRQVEWASGTHGTYLRTMDGGQTWTPAQVPGASALDFRAVVAFSADEAFLMSAGPGDHSSIYHTSDGGRHWQLQFTNTNPKGFFDSMAFWDPKHGIVLGDPIPDETGKLKFELLETDDGQTWHPIPTAGLPEALEGEGAFAASNTCIALLQTPGEPWKHGTSTSRDVPSTPGAPVPAVEDSNIWFATGGKAARVFHSQDRGQTWEVRETPIAHGPESAGIFSIAFGNPNEGVIAGGDYKKPNTDGPNLAFTHDGGKTWQLAATHPQAYFSAVAYDMRRSPKQKTPAPARIFVLGQDFVLDLQPSARARRLQPAKRMEGTFNSISPFPEGGAIVVGAKGVIATIR
jgi:photosystem II stability/assembly factor-like uncharacterized protein